MVELIIKASEVNYIKEDTESAVKGLFYGIVMFLNSFRNFIIGFNYSASMNGYLSVVKALLEKSSKFRCKHDDGEKTLSTFPYSKFSFFTLFRILDRS